jgi:acylphosphatase
MSAIRLRLLVEGRVQGVLFRDFTRQRAHALGVRGWVRNLVDGRVEAMLEGEEDAVQSLVGQIREGPPYAHVTHVEVTRETYQGEFEDFRIVY